MNRFILLSLVGLLFMAGCKHPIPESSVPGTQESEKKQLWHCPMHPRIIRDQHDKCPICGMELVAIASHDDDSHSASPAGESVSAGPAVQIEASILQKIGVRTDMADRGTVGREISADADGVLDRAAEVSVTVRTMGYVEVAAPLREGDKLRAGQILAQFYAPELVAAQGDWLAAHAGGDSAAALAARQRLMALGVSSELLDGILRSGKVRRSVPLVSPVSGWLRTRNAVAGQAAMAGQELFRVVEGAGALLEARLPQSALVQVGDRAQVLGDGMAKVVAVRVVAVLPEVERATRSVTVRLAPEKGAVIRVGGLYQVRFQSRLETGLVIPENAVLHSGRRDMVFVAEGGGKFRPVAIELGPTSEGRTLVRSGLEPGDEVVVSAQFLLDGESRLQAAIDQLAPGASDGGSK